MLLELTIRNFAIIDELRLRFERGFNVMTGETGAGKSIIIDAVGLLLGGRAQTEFIRRGADRASLEGLFALDEVRLAQLRPLLVEHGVWEGSEDDEEPLLIVTRELNSGGPNLCRLNGKTVPLSLLKEIAAPLVDIHGQSEHLSLMNPRRHVDFLDRFAGTLPLRQRFADAAARLRRVREQIDRLSAGERELEFRIDRLQYIVDEIEAADLSPDEEEVLQRERRILANSEKLSQGAEAGFTLLYEEGGDGQSSILEQLGEVVRAIQSVAKLDDSMVETQEVVEQAVTLLDDVARTLAHYRDGIEYDPQRLEEIEQRLSLIFNLKRKYGPTIAEILEEQARCQSELEEIEQAEERLEALAEEEETLLDELGRLGSKLAVARRAAAEKMAQVVEKELADLRMERARFEVQLTWQRSESGVPVADPPDGDPAGRFLFDSTGIDRVEFLLAPNPGEGLKPLARIASGGESSRIMLAIKTALGHADDTPTLIFDEIDTGVGGRVGQVVGRKLYGLAGNRQVLCITHLPQIAAFGDQHFHIRKEVTGERTLTRVSLMDESGRVAELAQMIGSGEAAWTAAAELRERVRQLQMTEMQIP